MRLIKQTILHFQDERSDKLYEVDLCEVTGGKFVVNFRYGRRGSTLRDGTKTPAAVPREKADAIYDKLVSSKTEKGYVDTAQAGDASGDIITAEVITEDAGIEFLDGDNQQLQPNATATLNRLRLGHTSSSTWRLSRAVWRAGELRIAQAEPILVSLIRSGDSMLDYCIAWALAQVGGESSVAAVESIEADPQQPSFVRWMAIEALRLLRQGAAHEKMLAECFRGLPDLMREFAKNGPADELGNALERHLQTCDAAGFGVLKLLYLIDNEHTRPALIEFLKTAPLQPNHFRPIRHIFKAAEMRRDGEIFGLIGHRFETTPTTFRMKDPWYYNYKKEEKPTIGPGATKAFSIRTRDFLRRRIWWTLRRLAQQQDADFVNMACGVLAPFTDADARPPRSLVRIDWQAYRASNWRTYTTITKRYDSYAGYLAFCHLLYGNSPRYEVDSSRRYFQCQSSYSPGGAAPQTREESFPELWQREPTAVLDLIEKSRCEEVHRFATKVLAACGEFCNELPLDRVVMLLQAPYELTAKFGFELATKRYDASNPNIDLVIALGNCNYQPARKQARKWATNQQDVLFQNSRLVSMFVASRHSDTRLFAREVLRRSPPADQLAKEIVNGVCNSLIKLKAGDGEIAKDVADTLLLVFANELQRTKVEAIRKLMQHDLPEVQQFAAELVARHESLAQQPPADLLRAMLESEVAGVRTIGVRIIGAMPDKKLKEGIELLVQLTRSEREDIRQQIRPTVLRLASTDSEFGKSLADRLIAALLIPGAPEGVPSHTTRVILDDLSAHLGDVSADTVWKLLQSRSGPANEVGGFLLPTHVKMEELAVAEIVKLGGHEILAVRRAAWQAFESHADHVQTDIQAAIKLLDSNWQDTREFARQYFRNYYANTSDHSAAVLVSICDSVRPEVQAFGREIITSVFQEQDAEEYLLKLSEHPSRSMQRFASNLFESRTRGDVQQLQQLTPYFVSVLSRVNQGRVAKDRVFELLEAEAANGDETTSEVVAEILSRVSATAAIGDKARAIEIMLKIRERHPKISVPLEVQPIEVRSGV